MSKRISTRSPKPKDLDKLRELLKQGALANADLNLEIAEEWFPVEQEAWLKLDYLAGNR
jgi:hypothetical protein